MTFDHDDPRLTAFALGELDEADRAEVEAILPDDPEAARFVAGVRGTAALLSAALRDEPAPGLSIVQKLELDSRIGQGHRTDRSRVRRSLVAAAAGLLLALGGGGVGYQLARLGSAALDHDGAIVADSFGAASPTPAPPSVEEFPMIAALPATRSMPGNVISEVGAVPAPSFDSEMTPPRDHPGLNSASEPSPPSLEIDPGPMLLPHAGKLSSREGAAPSSPQALAPKRLAQEVPELLVTDGTSRTDASSIPDRIAQEARHDSDEAPQSRARIDKDSLITEQGAALPRDRTSAAFPPQAAIEPGASGDARAAPSDGAKRGGIALEAEGDRRSSAALAPRRRAANVESENVVEVVEVPEGKVVRRFTLDGPIGEVEVDPTGVHLLATAADRTISIFDIEDGNLVSRVQIDGQPIPSARFGRNGELILSRIGRNEADGESLSDPSWFLPRLDPLVFVPINPGRESFAALRLAIEAQGVPLGKEFAVAKLVNTPDYPFAQPEAAEPVSIDARIVPCPWRPGHLLVRIALLARDEAMNEAVAPPPIVAEGVAMSVEFNPARVEAYRPIGFDPQGVGPKATGLARLSAGESSTLLFELSTTPEGALGAGKTDLPLRYQAPSPPISPAILDELATVSLSFRVPGEADRRTIDLHVRDIDPSKGGVPDDARFASALAWLGFVLQGRVGDDPKTLDAIAAMIQSCRDEFLPEDRRAALGLIDAIRAKSDEPPNAPADRSR